jgi:hypothetical protein
VLARTPKRRLRRPPFSMHRHDDLPFATLVVLMAVKATPVLCEPFPKCRAFHCLTPHPQRRLHGSGKTAYAVAAAFALEGFTMRIVLASGLARLKISMRGAFRRCRTPSLVICAIAATSFAATSSQATTVTYLASLSGTAESPPVASPGTGTATVVIDDVLQTMSVNAVFSGLIGNTTATFIHCCTAVAGIGNATVASQTPTFFGFPLGVTSGTYFNSFDMSLSSSYSAAFITANGGTTASAFAALLAGLNAGEAYFNIHTDAFPGGEIRGFLIAQTPVPAAALLFGTGLGVMGLLGWRRKRPVGGSIPAA